MRVVRVLESKLLVRNLQCSTQGKPTAGGGWQCYLVAFSVVVAAEGVEGSDLHPALAQLLSGVVEETTDVSADLEHKLWLLLLLLPLSWLTEE